MDTFVQLSFFIGLIAALSAGLSGIFWIGGGLGMKATRALGRVNPNTEGASDAAVSSFGKKTMWRAGVAALFFLIHFGYPLVAGGPEGKTAKTAVKTPQRPPE